MMRNKFLILVLLCLNSILLFSQGFSYSASIENTNQNGWHKIIVGPEVVCNSKPTLDDLRLYDSKNEEVPFVILRQDRYHPTEPIIYNPVKIETFTIEEDKEKKLTRLNFKFEKPQLLNVITFTVDSPGYYYRIANLYSNSTGKDGRRSQHFEHTFYFNSKSQNICQLNDLFLDDFTIEILNEDNKPLHITRTVLEQLAPLLVADLKKDEKYTLKFGDPNLNAPKYDIHNFIDYKKKMPYVKTTVLETLNVTPLPSPETKVQSFWQKPWFLWSSIGIGALILFIFSASLIKEMRKDQNA